MDASNLLETLAVLIEIAITIFAILIAIQNKKTYGWFIAATFALFVFFDIGRIISIPISGDLHSLILLAACGSMLYAIWLMYGEK